MVGASSKTSRPSFGVFRYLVHQGYECVPVNPTERDVLGIPAFRTLREAAAETGPFDVVDVFRRSEAAGEFADQAVAVGAKGVWFQMGVVDEDAYRRTTEAGVPMVMDVCPSQQWFHRERRGA